MKAEELLAALERLVKAAADEMARGCHEDLSSAWLQIPFGWLAQLRALLDDSRRRIRELEQQIEQERAAHKSELRRAWRPWPPEGLGATEPDRSVEVMWIHKYDRGAVGAGCSFASGLVFYRELEESKP